MISLLLSLFVMVQMGAGVWWYIGLGVVSLISFIISNQKHDAIIKTIASYIKITTEKSDIEEE